MGTIIYSTRVEEHSRGQKGQQMKYKEVQKRFFKHARCFVPAMDPVGDGGDGGATGTGSPGGGGSSAGSGSEGSGDGSGSVAPAQKDGGAGATTSRTLDDLLKDPVVKKEFDSRINKAVNTGIANAQAKWQLLLDDKVSEADKLARMNEQEKADYLRQKKEKELADREADITKRELMATAKNTLADKKLPQELASILVYTDAKACNESITAVEKAFNAAVEEAVKEKLKGGEPPRSASAAGNGSITLEQQVAKAVAGGLY